MLESGTVQSVWAIAFVTRGAGYAVTKIYPYPGAENAETYEWENRIADPERRIETFMESVAPIAGRTVVDIGAGSVFHAVWFAQTARHVYAVEPALGMLVQAHQRLANEQTANVSLIAADAESIPLQDGIADVIHSRFAYFFGPAQGGVVSCEPGIREAQRLLKPGGAFFVIDNELLSGQFATFMGGSYYSDLESAQQERDHFWRAQGFDKMVVEASWAAPDRDILRQVITMEFPADHVEPIMSQIDGASLSYHYDVYWYRQD